jgi:hypothetical protein
LLGVRVISIYEKNYISTLPTLPIIKRSKIGPKIFPTLPTLLWVRVISIYEKNYVSTLPTLPILKRSKISPKISPTLLWVRVISIYEKKLYLNFANFAYFKKKQN